MPIINSSLSSKDNNRTNKQVYFIDNQISSHKVKEKQSDKRLNSNQIIEIQDDKFQNKIKKNKKINIYLRNENFYSHENGSQDYTDSNDENSKDSDYKKKPTSNTIITNKTEILKNDSVYTIKERYFWSKEKIEGIKERFKIAKYKIIKKENNDFDQIYEWIETNNDFEFL